MRFRGLVDPPANSYAGPLGLGVSLALLHIYIRVHEDPGSYFKFIYGHMRFRGLFDLWLDFDTPLYRGQGPVKEYMV